ncbi:MAG: TolC family outer membrane protein [Hyphomicrobiales bacterium]|nr:TolC family outer membrane protein [Hyphomicrobiales bacterium]
MKITSATAILLSLIGTTVLNAPYVASAKAETIASALARAYMNNPDLNSQRAAVRGADEEIPRAKSGYRPTIAATASAGYQDNQVRALPSSNTTHNTTHPRSVGLSVTETLWNGNRTENSVTQAESKMLGARETMRSTEQSVLSDASTYYMNVLRDTAILNLNKRNITVLQQQLQQTQDRFKVGEVTQTDVAQSQANLAQARTGFFAAQANLEASIANFHQVIGVQPTRLEPARPLDNLIPKSLTQAIEIGQSQNPAIRALLHAVEAAQLQVNIDEAELYPTVGVSGNVSHQWDFQTNPNSNLNTASVIGQITIPIYGGGEVYARTREAKELVAQNRLQVDLQRAKVRAAVVTAWGQVQSSRQAISSSQATVKAAEIALRGVREEAKVGQRTTLDVLNAQQTLLNARVTLVSSQRDRVVATYALMSAIGKLSATNLHLAVNHYNPNVHYEQVKDKWIGLRTPDGQ